MWKRQQISFYALNSDPENYIHHSYRRDFYEIGAVADKEEITSVYATTFNNDTLNTLCVQDWKVSNNSFACQVAAPVTLMLTRV